MEIAVLASGSGGNCYLAEHNGASLLLDCGLPVKEIRERSGFRVSGLAGCLLTHEHMDHAKAAVDLMRAGVDLYCSRGTAEALQLDGHRLNLVRSREPVDIGGWRVLPFDTVHDSQEPLGFLALRGSERLLYATDTAYLPYRFSGVTRLMIECNYDFAVLKANVAAGLVPREVKYRVLQSHMSLETLVRMLQANDLRQLREVLLLHLSSQNIDACKARRMVQAVTGKVVRVA